MSILACRVQQRITLPVFDVVKGRIVKSSSYLLSYFVIHAEGFTEGQSSLNVLLMLSFRLL